MPQPDPTPPPDDLPIMVGPGDVDQLLKTAEALAGEIAAAVGLADPRAQNADAIAPPAPMPSPVKPVEGHTIIEEAPPTPTATPSMTPLPGPTPAKTITPADAVPAEVAPSAITAFAEPPAPALEPPPFAADPVPQAEKEAIGPQPQPEPIVDEAPVAAAQPDAAAPAKAAHTEAPSPAPPKISTFRRVLQRVMRLARGVALAPILLLAALAWLIDRPFAKTPARVKNYVGAIALATAITAVLSFVLPGLLKNDPFAGESTASESAPD